jgi:predicted nucleic acid-binding protein
VCHENDWEAVDPYIDGAMTLNMSLVELASALRKKIASNLMEVKRAMELMEEYSLVADVIDQSRYLGRAIEISALHGTSIYDSIFIAAAIEIGCDLVSSDEKQLKIAEKLGIRTIKC